MNVLNRKFSYQIWFLVICLSLVVAWGGSTVWSAPNAAAIPLIAGDCDGSGTVDDDDTDAVRAAIELNDGMWEIDCDANGDGALDAADLACVPLLIAGEGCQPPDSRSLIGTNLDKVVNYTSQYVFANVMKQSSGWVAREGAPTFSYVTDPTTPFDLDENGWVKSLPACDDPDADYCILSTFMFSSYGANYPAGRYTVTFEGTGSMSFDSATILWGESCAWPSCVDKFYVIDVQPNNGIVMNITATDPNDDGDYIRNIQVHMPGYAPGEPNEGKIFHDDFTDSLRPYGVLRFMDWMRTNWQGGSPVRSASDKQAQQSVWVNPETVEQTRSREIFGSLARPEPVGTLIEWADRPETGDAFYSLSIGTPVETMVALVNEVDAAPWFNMPHQASDAYVTEFATLVRDTITNTQPIYVEYSNEIWNTSFDQGSWIEDQGELEFPTVSPQQARYKWYGQRTNEMCAIWRQVFDAVGADRDRIVCVVGAQAASGAYEWILDNYLNCTIPSSCAHTEIDAVAIAPYFGAEVGRPENVNLVETWTQTDLFSQLTVTGVLTMPNGTINPLSSLAQAQGSTANYVGAAAERSVQLISYEGGQHLAGIGPVQSNPTVTDLFINANKDAQMGDAYTRYLDAWQDAGGGLFVHFNNMTPYTQFGSWGAREFYDEDTPKTEALEAFGAQPLPAPMTTTLSFGAAVSTTVTGTVTTQVWDVPILINTISDTIQTLSFVLDYDDTQLVPNTITLEQGNHQLFEADDGAGKWSITLFIDTAQTPLEDGELLTIRFDEAIVGGDGVQFAAGTLNGDPLDQPLTCGHIDGFTIPCDAAGQTLQIDAPVIVTPTDTSTPIPPTATDTSTPIPPTATDTSTPIPPTATDTSTPIPPTATDTSTPIPPTATHTSTPVPPTATHTSTPVPPTATHTSTPIPPTATDTSTPIPPTATDTSTPVPPTPTNTFTPIPPTPTDTSTPIPPTPTDTSTPIPPTPTDTSTPIPPTPTDTSTPIPPTPTDTSTPIPPTPTDTSTPIPPTATDTSTPVPPTLTATPTEVGIGVIDGIVFHDFSSASEAADGVYTPDDGDKPLNDVLLTLQSETGVMLEATTTMTGYYQFTQLPQGYLYTIHVDPETIPRKKFANPTSGVDSVGSIGYVLYLGATESLELEPTTAVGQYADHAAVSFGFTTIVEEIPLAVTAVDMSTHHQLVGWIGTVALLLSVVSVGVGRRHNRR